MNKPVIQLTEFDRLRDFLYLIMEAEKRMVSVFRYKDRFWKIWVWDRKHTYDIIRCTETISGDLIEFDVQTGKYKAVKKITGGTDKYYFVIVEPTQMGLIENYTNINNINNKEEGETE